MGGGFNAGAHYAFTKVRLGVSYRSPVWFRQFNWNRKDLAGVSHQMRFKMSLPAGRGSDSRDECDQQDVRELIHVWIPQELLALGKNSGFLSSPL